MHQAQSVISRSFVSLLIMCTGGEYLGVRHDRHSRASRLASPWTPDGAEGQARPGLAPTAFDLQPAVSAVQALADRGGGLG